MWNPIPNTQKWVRPKVNMRFEPEFFRRHHWISRALAFFVLFIAPVGLLYQHWPSIKGVYKDIWKMMIGKYVDKPADYDY